MAPTKVLAALALIAVFGALYAATLYLAPRRVSDALRRAGISDFLALGIIGGVAYLLIEW